MLVKVQRIAPLDRAVRDAARIPAALVEAIFRHMEDYVGRDLDGTTHHTERLRVSFEEQPHAAAVVFFVDVDGTLNVLSVDASA